MILPTLYTTLPQNLIKKKLLDLIERALKQLYKNEGTLYLACNDKKACSPSVMQHVVSVESLPLLLHSIES